MLLKELNVSSPQTISKDTLDSSLWLVPPPQHPVTALLKDLIESVVPSLFPKLNPPRFSPHVTLTSEIPPSRYGSDAPGWLDSLDFPSASDVVVKFTALDCEEPFFRKCNLKVEKAGGLVSLAKEAREVGVLGSKEKGREVDLWAIETYRPHCSLM